MTKEKPRSVWSTEGGKTKKTTTRSIAHPVKYPHLSASYFTVGRDCNDLMPAIQYQLSAIERRHSMSLAGVTLSVAGCLALAALALQLAGVAPW